MKICLFVGINFILLNSILLALFLMWFQYCSAHQVLKYIIFSLTPLLNFISVDKDVDLWTFIVLTEQTTNTSVFLLFHSNQFFLLSPTTIFTIRGRSSLFFASNNMSAAHLKLFKLFPSTLIPGYPSRFRIIIPWYRERRSEESTHPFLTQRFIF